MNNMLEYMTGGPCYKCGGKVRYADGGENMEGQSPMGPVAEVGQKRQPTTLDASAKQLMTFLLDQLSKGTSERILRKTLVDSGVKADQADELILVAKQEFDKTISEGDYSTSEQERQMEMQAREQQMAQQQQMGMMNQAGPSAGPGAGMDPSMMAMNQQGDQSNVADAEMQEGRFGGSMRRLRRMNMGGTCPDGLMWSDATGTCIPTATTANMMQAGAGPVNLGTGNPVQTQNAVKQGTDTYNNNMMRTANLQDKNRNAEGSYYDNLLNANQTKRKTGFDNSMAAMGVVHQNMMDGKMPWQQKPVTPTVPNVAPVPNITTTGNARFGGLARFMDGGMKQYGAGGTEDGCPIGYYKGPDGDCLKIFGSDQSQKQYQEYQNWYGEKALDPSMSRSAPLSQDEWNKENPAQDQMVTQGKQYAWDQGATDRNKKFQGYLDWHNEKPIDPTMNRAAPQTYDEWETENYAGQKPIAVNNAANNNNNNNDAPIDPNSPYIVRTDKNKIANLDNNWVNKALAVGSNLGSAQTLGATGAFGPYLQAILGATGFASSAILGAKKIFAGNKRTRYDDKGNVFEDDNKGSFRNAGRNNSQNQGNNGSQNASGNITDSGVNEDIPEGMMMQSTKNGKGVTDKYGQPMGVNRQGELASYDNPLRNHMIQMGTDEDGVPIMDKYDDNDRMNNMLDITGKTKKDFRTQGPALFGENKYGTKEDLQQDYDDAGFFGKMRQRQQFKRDAAWDPDLTDSSAFMNRVNPPAEDPAVVKRDGGEWDPFTDNRRKLRISMPMYGPGGAINNETSPYTQQEWAQVQSKTFPLKPEDIQPYNDYVASFNNTTGNQTNATTQPLNMTNNANNALSANPNANMVDTKEVTINRGDALGARVAQNMYSGVSGWNAGLDEINGRKRINEIGQNRQQVGNSMAYAAVNPWNQSGSNMTNATQGSNYQVDSKQQGAGQDYQTTLNSKFGGSIYRKGGTYNLSPQALQAIIAMGGEVEFLD